MSFVPSALATSALAYFVTAWCFALARGGVFSPPGAQVALDAAVIGSVACLFGIVGLHPKSGRPAIACWVGLNAWLMLSASWGAVAAVGTLAVIRPSEWSRARYRFLDLGFLIALAFAVAFLLQPRTFKLGLGPFAAHGLTVVTLLATLGFGRWLAVTRRMKLFLSLCIIALSVVALSPLAKRLASHQVQTIVRNQAAPNLKTDVVLLILDTVRADRLSLYGYGRRTAPALEQFASDHPGTVVYPIAFSTATWTLPAHGSLFSGLLPSEHAVHEGNLFGADGLPLQGRLEAPSTLAERLKAQGYGTGFVYANGWLDLATGLDRGFDFFRRPQTVTEVESISSELRLRWLPGWFRSQGTRAEQINHDLLQFLDSCKPGPCFAVANYMDAHAPYIPSHEHLGRFGDGRREPADRPQYGDTARQLEHLSGLYDESIRTLDDALGALFVALEERQVLRNAWVVITADHGEAFGEHGEVEHSSALYGEVTQVPLIIKPPVGVELPAPQGAVSLLDVAQTILGIAGAGKFPRGRDLRHVISQPHAVLIEMFANANKLERALGSRAGHPGRAIVRGAMKLVDHDGEVELFDLGTDPEETIDLAGPMPRVVEELEAHLRGALEELPPPTDRPGIPLTREEENRLRALGYIR